MGVRLEEAIGMLRERYGAAVSSAADGDWRTLVAVVADQGGAPARRRGFVAEGTVLATPSDAAAVDAGTLADALGRVPRAAQKGTILRSLAQWWTGRFGDDRTPDWGGDVESLRDELRRLRGINLELADRILLFVAGLETYPVDRSTLRVVCRHGWLGAESEYDEWQSALRHASAAAGVDLREVSAWMAQVGHDHCGPQPKCAGCPLEPLLPPGGPYEPEE